MNARKAGLTITLAVIGALIAYALWGASQNDPDSFPLDVIVALVSLGVTAWLYRQPFAGGVTAAVLAAVSPVATPVASFAAFHTARRRPFREALVVTVLGILAQAVQGIWRTPAGVSYGWWLLLMTAAYAALLGWGTWAQARANLLRALHERARRAEEEQERRIGEARRAERNRIAREMHDVLAHRLSLLATYAGAVEYRPDAPPERLTEAARVIRAGAHQALEDLREVITLMRSGDDDNPDAPAGQTLADLPGLLAEARAAGQRVDFDDGLDLDGMPPALGRCAYRVVQEGLTNARKHAPGQAVTLQLTSHPATIVVRNKTVPGESGPGAGTGLAGLTERVTLVGGELEHEIDADGEFRLTVRLPWPS
ncbi:signal transduction histidine kinase [Hamadaea flava]|uniref:histidine kinase n=1 Tax=Hamadaea flava TaxID=1742688 RepID=A0ABV8M0I7_9ACTN|nr:histidine kinase [Hamadaea flava]MCP2329025.1 signal transduction histidine kinase [Hamadaea flava]